MLCALLEGILNVVNPRPMFIVNCGAPHYIAVFEPMKMRYFIFRAVPHYKFLATVVTVVRMVLAYSILVVSKKLMV